MRSYYLYVFEKRLAGLDPVLDDGPAHQTACFFPLTIGEDLSTAVPDLKAS